MLEWAISYFGSIFLCPDHTNFVFKRGTSFPHQSLRSIKKKRALREIHSSESSKTFVFISSVSFHNVLARLNGSRHKLFIIAKIRNKGRLTLLVHLSYELNGFVGFLFVCLFV